MTNGRFGSTRLLCPLAVLLLAGSASAQTDPDATDRRAITVRGRVVDETGNPVAGALVPLVFLEREDMTGMAMLRGAFPHESVPREANTSVELARIRTDRDGRFRATVRVAAEGYAGLIAANGARVDAVPIFVAALTERAATSAWFQIGWVPEGSDVADPIRLVVYPRSRLTIRLEQHDGAPLAGREVVVGESVEAISARHGTSTMARPMVPLRFTAETGDDGCATFAVPPGVDLEAIAPSVHLRTAGRTVRVGDSGWFRPSSPVTPLRLRVGDDETFVMRLPRAARIAGRVVDGSGAPVVGAHIHYADDRPRRSWRTTTDDDGRFAFASPLPLGGALQILPQRVRRIYLRHVPTPATGDVDVTITLYAADVTLRPDRPGCSLLASDDECSYVRFPKATKQSADGATWSFGWYDESGCVIATPSVPASSEAPPALGAVVVRGVRPAATRGPIEVPPFSFDATLTVGVRTKPGASINGALYLMCTSVDRHPDVPVFAEATVPAAETVRFDRLQAGDYVLGFIPAAGQKRAVRAPDRGRLARSPRGYEPPGYWRGDFGSVANARRNTWWRPVRIRPGDNRVEVDTTAPGHDGVLEVVAVDRNGVALPEFLGHLIAREGVPVSSASADEHGVMRIENVSPGLYEFQMWNATSGLRRHTVVGVPSDGTHRITLRFDTEAPSPPWPPRLRDATLEPSDAEREEIAFAHMMDRAKQLLFDGEARRARAAVFSFYRDHPASGSGMASLMVFIGGRAGQIDGGPLTDDERESLGKDDPLRATTGVLDAVDVLWRKVRRSDEYASIVGFRWEMDNARLEHLLRHGARDAARRTEFGTLLGESRAALKDATDYRAKRQLEALEALERRARTAWPKGER